MRKHSVPPLTIGSCSYMTLWDWYGITWSSTQRCLVISVSCQVMSLLIVVVCEVISTMEKASFKSKSPLDLALSHFQDSREAAASAALCEARAPIACWQSTTPSAPPPPPFQLPSLELSSFGFGAEPICHSFKEATGGRWWAVVSAALPLCTVGPPDGDGAPAWLFPHSSSDPYNWKLQTFPFTKKPKVLILSSLHISWPGG